MAKSFDQPASGTKDENKAKFLADMKSGRTRQRGYVPAPETEADPEDEDDSDLPPYLDWVWQAFTVLSRGRLVNEAGPQPILLTEVSSYCFLEGIIDEEDCRDLLHYILALDIEWCKITYARINKRREAEKKEAEKKAKARGRRR